jgi:hypothetical protein
MKNFFSALFATIFAMLVIIMLTWVIQGDNFFLYKYFAPKFEQTRRQVFEQSKAYKEGMVQELQNMQFEYIGASPEHKEALRSIILHRSADFDENKMPTALRDFIKGLKREKSESFKGE